MKRKFGIELDLSDGELSDSEIVSKKDNKEEKKYKFNQLNMLYCIIRSEKSEKENFALIKDPATKAAVMQAATKAAKDAILAGSTSEEVLQAAQNAIKAILTQFKPSGDAGLGKAIQLRDEILAREEENSETVSGELEINDYPPKFKFEC